MPFTRGFETSAELTDHFVKHRAEFGVSTKEDYEALADAFCGGPRDASTQECSRRRDRAILRYNPVTNEFGVLHTNNYIGTYFKLSRGIRYFQEQCTR